MCLEGGVGWGGGGNDVRCYFQTKMMFFGGCATTKRTYLCAKCEQTTAYWMLTQEQLTT